jgi:hypothetical protein
MIDVVSIIIAVVSLLGSLIAAGFTGFISFYIDQVKRRSATKALIHKYRDPLMLAAYDLQSRIWGIVQFNLLGYAEDEEKRELVFVYTSFLIGQYLSWTYILRRQAQFLRFSTEKTNVELNRILDKITDGFSNDQRRGEGAFMLWRGQQMAIGELMTHEQEKDQQYCMGYAAFSHKYHQEPEFRKWFEPIDKGITLLVDGNKRGDALVSNRLRRLQHLLVDLVLLLDKDLISEDPDKKWKVDAARGCRCADCPVDLAVVSHPASKPEKLPEP